jgi:hypothetical protein
MCLWTLSYKKKLWNFSCIFKVTEERSRSWSWIRIHFIGTDPRIRIRTKCHGSPTLCKALLIPEFPTEVTNNQ